MERDPDWIHSLSYDLFHCRSLKDGTGEPNEGKPLRSTVKHSSEFVGSHLSLSSETN